MKQLIILALIPFAVYGQKITENKKDDMTGHTIIKTSKERLTGMSSNWIKAGVIKINNAEYLALTISNGGSFFIIREGAELMIKLDNDSIIKGYSNSLESANDGVGGKQADCIYKFANTEPLKSKNISKIRVYTTEGYVDFDVKKGDIIKKEFELIASAK
jgi:hypothetical protein